MEQRQCCLESGVTIPSTQDQPLRRVVEKKRLQDISYTHAGLDNQEEDKDKSHIERATEILDTAFVSVSVEHDRSTEVEYKTSELPRQDQMNDGVQQYWYDWR